MGSILRRLLFAVGAMLLAGGWGLTGFVGQHQQAAGDDALVWWVEGVDLSDEGPRFPYITARGAGTGKSPSLEEVLHMLETSGGTKAAETPAPPEPPAQASRVFWPSMHLYLLSVAVMVLGAGLMGLAAPWGADEGTIEYESSSAQMPLRLQRGP